MIISLPGIEEFRFGYNRMDVKAALALVGEKLVCVNGFFTPEQKRAIFLIPAVVIHSESFGPIATAQPEGGIGSVAEDIVGYNDIRGDGTVVIEHEMSSVSVGALTVSPAEAGIQTGVMHKTDVVRFAGLVAIPVLERVFTVPDYVASIGDIFLDVCSVSLICECGIVNFP